MQGLAMSVGIFRDRHDRRKKKKTSEQLTLITAEGNLRKEKINQIP